MKSLMSLKYVNLKVNPTPFSRSGLHRVLTEQITRVSASTTKKSLLTNSKKSSKTSTSCLNEQLHEIFRVHDIMDKKLDEEKNLGMISQKKKTVKNDTRY